MEPTTLGVFIRTWRKKKALTQEKLAEAIKVSQAAITDWERGKARPGVGPMLALADEMRIHPRKLQALPTKWIEIDPTAKVDPDCPAWPPVDAGAKTEPPDELDGLTAEKAG